MLKEIGFQTAYRSGADSLLDDFYVPALQESLRYDRAVGYFSSSLYAAVAVAFSDFAQRGGRIRLICSPSLTAGDFEAMQSGVAARQLAHDVIRRDLNKLYDDPQAIPATQLLATLVASDIVDIRIAFADDPRGLFHDKIGIFEDEDGRRVSFRGSANETWRAWGLNHESFDVFCSACDETELLRTREHADIFRALWLGDEPGIHVERLDTVTLDRIEQIALDDLDDAIAVVRVDGTLGSRASERC